jgi:hypothetical protein
MLRQAQQTLFIAVEEQDLQTVLDIVQPPQNNEGFISPSESDAFGSLTSENAQIIPQFGGTVVFIWDIEQYEGQSVAI